MKHNTIEWPKVHNLQNSIYFFPGIHPRTLVLVPRRFEPRPPLVANRNLCYYWTWDIGKLHFVPPEDGFRGKRRIHPNDLKKIKVPFKCIVKNHALELKANFIINYFKDVRFVL